MGKLETESEFNDSIHCVCVFFSFRHSHLYGIAV